MFFYPKCPLSHNYDKQCQFAYDGENGTECKYIIGWYHELSIANLDRCFIKMKNRDKLAWRNRMIKKFGEPKI